MGEDPSLVAAPPAIDFRRRPVRSRVEAWALAVGDGACNSRFGSQKRRILAAMDSPILEIGPGPGVNMKYYRPGSTVIAIEPNPAMFGRLRAAANANDIELDLREERAESLDLADGSVNAAVGTLVLCGVAQPARCLGEIRRVLAPGRPYFFVEHVAAPAGSMTRRLQRVVKGPHRWAANGCEVDRDTESTIRAAGFGDIALERIDMGPGGLYVRYGILGVATK